MHGIHVLVVGMNPSSYVGPDRRSLAMSKLNVWMEGIGIHYFSFVNASPDPGVARVRDVQWDVLEKCLAYEYDAVLSLGGFASRILQRLGARHFRLPHPSGLNRQLNDSEYVRRILSECRDYITDGRHG